MLMYEYKKINHMDNQIHMMFDLENQGQLKLLHDLSLIWL